MAMTLEKVKTLLKENNKKLEKRLIRKLDRLLDKKLEQKLEEKLEEKLSSLYIKIVKLFGKTQKFDVLVTKDEFNTLKLKVHNNADSIARLREDLDVGLTVTNEHVKRNRKAITKISNHLNIFTNSI